MADGSGQNGRRRMEDVARHAGVSQMTVSRALRTPDKVAPATRARIAAAITELDYVPDLVAGTGGCPAEPLDVAVGFSNLAAARAMTLALHGYGYRRIAFVGTAAEDDRRGRLRREGYRTALAELGAGPPREVALPRTLAGITD